MNHEHAVAAQFSERYVYGDLPGKERDDFEEHLADCSLCSEDVMAAQAFAANMRAVFHEQAAFVGEGRLCQGVIPAVARRLGQFQQGEGHAGGAV